MPVLANYAFFGGHMSSWYLALFVRLCSKNFKSVTLLNPYKTLWDRHYLSIPFLDGKSRCKAFKQLVKGYTTNKCKPGSESGSSVPGPVLSFTMALSYYLLCCNCLFNDMRSYQTACPLNMEPCWSCLYLSIPSVITMPGI